MSKRWSKSETLYLPAFKRLYVEEGMSVEEIANSGRIPMSRALLYRWVKKHGMAKDRQDYLGAPEAMAVELYRSCKTLVDKIRERGEIHAGEADQVLKLITAADKLKADLSYRRVAIRVLSDFIDFLHRKDPLLLQQLSPHLNDIREHVKVRYGK